MKTLLLILVLFGATLPLTAFATPTTTFWAPSTATCQAFAVPHITYDNYFGSTGAYPNDAGLTVGFLPWEKIQGEAGFDLLYPSSSAWFFNGKLCTPEGSMFTGSPAISFGYYGLGTQTDVTNYNIMHVMAQKSLPWGGYVAAGVYHGSNPTLFTNSDGEIVQTGAMIAATSPDIDFGFTGLKKINFVGDIQTGKNLFGAWGVGTNLFFNDNVALLTGPVFFLDKALQPGGNGFLWTMQLDVDIPFTKPSGAAK